MEILRTPDERFENLEGYAFTPHYLEVKGGADSALRMHYLDEGPRDAASVLLLHGNPTWSYLYRRFVPPLVARGYRVLAPDLMGFGRSDKPSQRADYTMARHLAWLGDWLTRMQLRDVTLFCQDWGGLLGLCLVAGHAERFTRVLASNTGLPCGEGVSPGLERWIRFSQSVPELPIARVIQSATLRKLGEGEIHAYEAPFPDGRFQSGALEFPLLIPAQPENPGVAVASAAWQQLERFDKPFLTVFGDSDPVFQGTEKGLIRRIPGAKGQPHQILHASHFIQEDQPDELVASLDRFVKSTR